ncbi:MAG: hypothetical protein AABY22_31610 [Nanoarchaeota archaeon]
MLQKVSINRIEEKEIQKGKNIGAPYLVIDTNEGRFSVFSETLFDEINKAVNKEVEIDVLTVGKYRNVVGVGKIFGDARIDSSNTSGKETERFGREPRVITRTSCIDFATRLAEAKLITLDQVKSTAEDLFDWIEENN